ncbi:MAG: hypothetical protein WKG06_18490 [Segetibacter sp.]
MKLPLHKGLVKIPLELRVQQQYGININECPCCKGKTLQLVQIYYPPCRQADDG